MVGTLIPSDGEIHSVRSHIRRATLGQSVALCAEGVGCGWHWVQYVTSSLAPCELGSGKSAGVAPGGSPTLAAASSSSSWWLRPWPVAGAESGLEAARWRHATMLARANTKTSARCRCVLMTPAPFRALES